MSSKINRIKKIFQTEKPDNVRIIGWTDPHIDSCVYSGIGYDIEK